ncbi:hypothetical protein AVEN_147627-1 [Araneus ventricosus]|uniref:Uncharacterized protein n=1 Tax=Araneus ventricosus TaxID=182803 RepID=A0A4Y2HEJ6_ARAVE|nr:hypothetical protein AVEN_147627-1 [Araneus ventricosus]
MLQGVVCKIEKIIYINPRGACVLLLLVVGSLLLRLFNALGPVGWAGLCSTTPAGEHLAPTYDLACNMPGPEKYILCILCREYSSGPGNRPTYTTALQGNRVSNLKPSGLRDRD